MEIDREKVKLIVRNLKLLVDALESEVLSDVDAYQPGNHLVGDDDDGYAD
tara:strand:- start:652 stop:801 length:150 start_codon:yes stop_codon:yes gene_type:complete